MTCSNGIKSVRYVDRLKMVATIPCVSVVRVGDLVLGSICVTNCDFARTWPRSEFIRSLIF